VKKDIIKSCITLYGGIEDASAKWWDWYEFSKSLTQKLGFSPNYVGASSKTFKSDKISTIQKAESKLKKAVEGGEKFQSLEVYALPDEFKQAAFDYNTYIVRYKGFQPHHITLAMPQETFNSLKVDEIVQALKEYIDFVSGEIYEISVFESPFFYASKANPPSYFKSLKVIREIT